MLVSLRDDFLLLRFALDKQPLLVIVNLLLAEVLRRRSHERRILRDNEKRYQALAEAGAVLFWEIDAEMRFTYVSDDRRSLLGNTRPLVGRSLDAFVRGDGRLPAPS